MIYIRSIPSSTSSDSKRDEDAREKALKLAEELQRNYHAQRENARKQKRIQLEIDQCNINILKLKMEIRALGGDPYVKKEREQDEVWRRGSGSRPFKSSPDQI